MKNLKFGDIVKYDGMDGVVVQVENKKELFIVVDFIKQGVPYCGIFDKNGKIKDYNLEEKLEIIKRI